jgi:hypothetical protein
MHKKNKYRKNRVHNSNTCLLMKYGIQLLYNKSMELRTETEILAAARYVAYSWIFELGHAHGVPIVVKNGTAHDLRFFSMKRTYVGLQFRSPLLKFFQYAPREQARPAAQSAEPFAPLITGNGRAVARKGQVSLFPEFCRFAAGFRLLRSTSVRFTSLSVPSQPMLPVPRTARSIEGEKQVQVHYVPCVLCLWSAKL